MMFLQITNSPHVFQHIAVAGLRNDREATRPSSKSHKLFNGLRHAVKNTI